MKLGGLIDLCHSYNISKFSGDLTIHHRITAKKPSTVAEVNIVIHCNL